MHRHPITIMILLLLLPFLAKAQLSEFSDFEALSQCVQKNFKIADTLRHGCEWNYAVVKLKTDKDGMITGYSFANEPRKGLSDLGFLIGHRFSKKLKIGRHPVVFYLATDNTETCVPKPTDLHYNPNDVIDQLLNMMDALKAKDPETIFVPRPIYIRLMPTQYKKE